jgi:hypothetical protein
MMELDYAPPFQMGHPIAFEAAKAIAAVMPAGLDRIFFANSGSEAVDTALKIAAAYFAQKTRGGVDLTDIAAVGSAVGYAGGEQETARRAEMAKSFLMAQGPTSGYRFGGIASGPESGYAVELHGTEAVVPLPDGRSIPVQMKGNTNSYEQTKLLTMELDKLESLVYIMQRQNDISNQLLQRQS